MKIEYNGKVHEVVINDSGHVVSHPDAEENIFFGYSPEFIVQGVIVAEVVDVEEEEVDGIPV